MCKRLATAGVLCWVLWAIAAVGQASGSEVRVQNGPCDPGCTAYLRFAAEPGEQNRVSATHRFVSAEDGEEVTVRDTAALRASHGCESIGEHAARCRFPPRLGLVDMTFRLGDRDDRFDGREGFTRAIVHGGAGNDVILGTGTGDILHGGAGHDTIDGKSGPDRVALATRTPVRIHLGALRRQGAPGSEDVWTNIEEIEAIHARGATLFGTSKSDGLFAGRGGRVYGRGGNDRLYAGPGGRVYGGTQMDVVLGRFKGPESRRGAPRSFGCGQGYDFVFSPRLRDLVRPRCEWIEVRGAYEDHFAKVRSRPTRREPFAKFSYTCARFRGCVLRLAARVGSSRGQIISRRTVRIPYERLQVHRYDLKFTDAGWRTLRESGALKAVVYFRHRPRGSNRSLSAPDGFSTILRARNPMP